MKPGSLPFPESIQLAPVLSQKTRDAMLPQRLSAAEFKLLCAAGECRDVAAGETLFHIGELGRSMYVVEIGQIHLEFGEGLPPKLLGAGEFLGELTLFIGDHARLASAMATQPSRLHIIDHAAFTGLLEREPSLIAQFMRRSFAYLVDSEQQLIANLKRRNADLFATLNSLRQTETQLSAANNLVRTDDLTGLINRRGLYHFLENLHEHRVANSQLMLLLIDMDHFKKVNDQFGHLVGDNVLRLVAHEIANAAAHGDLACRLGGDEFALLVQTRAAHELDERAEQILAAVGALRLPAPHQAISLSVSIGASLCDHNADWSSWYSDADDALYAAKNEGGDRWRMARSYLSRFDRRAMGLQATP